MSDETRQRLVDAAARRFVAPGYGVLRDVELAAVARDAGVSEATARRHFTIEELHAELVAFVLSPDGESAASGFGGLGWANARCDDMVDRLNDADHRVDEALQGVMDQLWPGKINDHQLRSQMALWPYVEGDRSVAMQLDELYKAFEDGIRRIFHGFLVRHTRFVHLREDWLSIDDFAVLVNQIAEGAAIRAHLHQALGHEGYGFDGRAPGRALRALVGSMLQFHDEDEHPLDAQFRQLSEQRQNGFGATPLAE